MISAPVPKNTGLYPQNGHFASLPNDFSASSKAAKPEGNLSASTALFAMISAPMAEITGFYP
jgi:hypothetical protein